MFQKKNKACDKCGSKNPIDAKFCINCSESFNEDKQVLEQPIEPKKESVNEKFILTQIPVREKTVIKDLETGKIEDLTESVKSLRNDCNEILRILKG